MSDLKMRDDSRSATVSSVTYSTADDHEVEFHYVRTNDKNQSTDSDISFRRGRCHSIIGCLEKIEKKLPCFHVERRGIERISPEDRVNPTIINTAMIWMGGNIIMSTFANGVLGPAVFKLDLYDSFVTIILFNLLGILPIAVMASFGPASGLRTMIFSRYSWGYYGASIMSIITAFASLAWAAINSIMGAQTLRVVFSDSLSIAIGISIIGMVSMIISFVGYKWIHIYERYSWIPVFIGYCILAGVGVKYFTDSEMVSPNTTTSNGGYHLKVSRVLSFGATCFGIGISWCPCAADYSASFPEDTSQLKIFLYTYIGNLLSKVPLQLLGVATYTGTYTNQNWARAYEMNNIGGLLGASLSSLDTFGKFLLIIFALSTITCNIYSLSLFKQVVVPIFKRVPRVLHIVIGTVIYILLAIVAEKNFSNSLRSIMAGTSYCFAIFIVVVFEEHLLFRDCSFKKYHFDIWNNRKALPISLAAILSALVGVVGIILGMSQTWFTGPIAKSVAGNPGEQGADVGFEIGFLFTAVTFPLFRLIESCFIH